MRILHVVASPRGDDSVSRRLGAGFLHALGERRGPGGLAVDTLDVWAETLPEFDAAGIGVKYKRLSGATMTDHERRVDAVMRSLIARFVAADAIVVGVPMWNWSLPYKLKQLIDLVSQRGALFDVADGAYTGLVRAHRGLVIGVRGQDRDAGFLDGPVVDADHHVGFVRFWLSAIGVARVDTVLADHGFDDAADASQAAALTRLRELAADFSSRAGGGPGQASRPPPRALAATRSSSWAETRPARTQPKR